MRKILAVAVVVLIIMSMVVPAFAVTPKWEYKAVKLPEIKVTIKIPNSVFETWFKEHPIKISYTSPLLS